MGSLRSVLRAEAIPVEDGVPSDEALFDLVGDSRFVLIGEPSARDALEPIREVERRGQ
ncbi:hypothetical protein OG735_39330 [Streptomyces sp. NBC_01210]|uniref:hypothetical protein n=1 Tax=Streptomyces sp. NBC_01210 TaxID=2903774 RepID=UPI002E0FB357|nr:hypothetical protein OG735_39330 [Streptomyces sp. NBC_01210]